MLPAPLSIQSTSLSLRNCKNTYLQAVNYALSISSKPESRSHGQIVKKL
jgi:hypothetical protein